MMMMMMKGQSCWPSDESQKEVLKSAKATCPDNPTNFHIWDELSLILFYLNPGSFCHQWPQEHVEGLQVHHRLQRQGWRCPRDPSLPEALNRFYAGHHHPHLHSDGPEWLSAGIKSRFTTLRNIFLLEAARLSFFSLKVDFTPITVKECFKSW